MQQLAQLGAWLDVRCSVSKDIGRRRTGVWKIVLCAGLVEGGAGAGRVLVCGVPVELGGRSMEGRVCDGAAALCLEILEGGERRCRGVARGEGLPGHCGERRNINSSSPTPAGE